MSPFVSLPDGWLAQQNHGDPDVGRKPARFQRGYDTQSVGPESPVVPIVRPTCCNHILCNGISRIYVISALCIDYPTDML
jgi:hypothetical protein